jgi:hypothetical protein
VTSRESRTAAAAQRYLDEAGFVWHQRFQLVTLYPTSAGNVFTARSVGGINGLR